MDDGAGRPLAPWQATTNIQRLKLRLILDDSPSLRSFLEYSMQESWEGAISKAANETGLPTSAFPE